MIKEIIAPLLVVAAIGLAAGVLLALAERFFGFKEEERTLKIRECLPGANCGACGFAGCDSYARALAEGKAEPNLCIPGAADVASRLSEVLGVEVAAEEPKVAFVNCNGHIEATEEKAIYKGLNTCRATALIYGGPFSCRFGCVGCGDCAKACPVNAICMEDGVARINSYLCIGCGMCVKTCPKELISFIPRKHKVVVMCNNKEKGAVARRHCQNACIACKKCEKSCPHGAVTVIDNLAVIDYDKCTGCGECASVCPTGCIKTTNFKEGKIS